MCPASQMWPEAIVLILYSNVQNFLFSDQTTSRPKEWCHFGEYPAVGEKENCEKNDIIPPKNQEQ